MNKELFNRFDEISHLPLKVYNRTAMMFNLSEDFGETVAKEYAGIFNDNERQQILIMQIFIQNKGIDFVKKEVTKGLVLVDTEESE